MKKGEIWLIEIPLGEGREQIGLRPGIILADVTKDIMIVVPLTSHKQALRFPYSFEIKKSEITNLDFDSIALVFQIRAIDKKRLFERLGSLENKDLINLDNTIKNLFKL